jgi:dienelactone hydrolase
MPRTRLLRWILTSLAALAIAGFLCIATLLASIWLDHRLGTTLPTPTGSFAVGRTRSTWTGETPDALAASPGIGRVVIAWSWYPAAVAPGAPTADYLPAAWRDAMDTYAPSRLMKLITRNPGRVRTHSTADADVSPRRPAYPVVILRAGASAQVTSYSTLAEDLASHGYVVVGIDAPYRTGLVVLPDGRVVTRTPQNDPELYTGEEFERVGARLLAAWTSDMAFALDRLADLNAADPSGRFTGRLDLTRVGALGHSFGGAQALQFCHEDARCTAGIDVDGAPVGSVIQAGVRQPFLFIESEHADSEPGKSQVEADLRSIYDRLPPQRRVRVRIRGANHFLFSDDGALLKSHVLMRILRLLHVVGMQGPRQLTVTAYCVRTFFDAYLAGESDTPPAMASPLYPEIQVLR